ncbi:MAG: hypothetical protein GTN38_04620 [Candidatus Aenigmarchaeota archaeon]|nr:hypothetical protein [Candidatus Aenigmarchaeota archaeon]
MELMSKRKWKKVFRDMGVSKKEFKEAWRDVQEEKYTSGRFGKAAVIGTLAGLSLTPSLALAENPPAEVEKVEEGSSKFLTGTYYQGIEGPSTFRFEGSSDGLPLGMEAYGLLDLDSDEKKFDVDGVFGEFSLSKDVYKGLSASARSVVASGMEDIAMLGMKYSPVMKIFDVLTVEFYPLQTDGKQTVYVYAMKKLADGKFFVDVLFKGKLDDYKPDIIRTEIGCGMDVGKGFQIVGQYRSETGGYKALLLGGRYSF